jgi:hypothetical protein
VAQNEMAACLMVKHKSGLSLALELQLAKPSALVALPEESLQ